MKGYGLFGLVCSMGGMITGSVEGFELGFVIAASIGMIMWGAAHD